MKPRFSNKRIHALTLEEVLLVIAVLAVAVALFLPNLLPGKRKAARIGCVNNLKQIGLAYRVWEGDNGDMYPMVISVTNGGSRELVATGDVLTTYLTMSNELGTPKILHCPQATNRTYASSFASLTRSNISYFVGVDVTNELNPQAILSGDDNFLVSGVPAKSGLLALTTNIPVSWSAARHIRYGNIGLADGSVSQLTDKLLREKLEETGLVTNRLAIP
jgi:competence protein ComGC